MIKYFSLFFIALLFFSSCSNGSFDSTYFFGCPYSSEKNSIQVMGGEYENVYQLSRSEDERKIIFSTVKKGHQPELFLLNESIVDEVHTATRLTKNEYIEFDPVTNNRGDYAYALHEQSVGTSKIFLNNEKLDLGEGFYKTLTLNDNYLVFHSYVRSEDENYLVVYDLGNGNLDCQYVDLYLDRIIFISDDSLLLQGINKNTGYNDMLTYDFDGRAFEDVWNGSDVKSCFLDETISDEELFGARCFTNEDDKTGQLLFLGLRGLHQNDPTGSLACSNNYLGRLSWNVAYRLSALAEIVASDAEIDFPVMSVVRTMIHCLLDVQDGDVVGWPTKKYSISGEDTLSLLVDDAVLLYPMLKLVNAGVLDWNSQSQIISIAKATYDKHEDDYDKESGFYHFKYAIPFLFDGVWLPFNQQNIFGLVLIELYKATGDLRYKERALSLAETFRAEWEFQADGRALWHYWTNAFYEGWSASDSFSANTPTRSAGTDKLYEDMSHAGINVDFAARINEYFPDGPISLADIDSLRSTFEGVKYGHLYSRFMSGDVEYQPASYSFIPRHSGWIGLASGLFFSDLSRGLPLTSPLFEGDSPAVYISSFLELRKHN